MRPINVTFMLESGAILTGIIVVRQYDAAYIQARNMVRDFGKTEAIRQFRCALESSADEDSRAYIEAVIDKCRLR